MIRQPNEQIEALSEFSDELADDALDRCDQGGTSACSFLSRRMEE